MIKGKMPEEIRASLGIVNDLTLEEEKGINDNYYADFYGVLSNSSIMWSFRSSLI